MSKPPRSPRILRLLAALEAIYSGDATPAEKLEAARLATKLLGKKPSKPRKKNVKMPAPSTPSFSGHGFGHGFLAPATLEPSKPADVLGYFDGLGKKTMMDLDKVQKLYDLQTNPSATPAERERAKDTISRIATDVLAEYLSRPEYQETGIFKYLKTGQPSDHYKVLYARNVIEFSHSKMHDIPVEPLPQEDDIVGNILMHCRYSPKVSTETV